MKRFVDGAIEGFASGIVWGMMMSALFWWTDLGPRVLGAICR